MDQTRTETSRPDPLDQSMYRVAHLHGSEWVTLRPADQHSPRVHDPNGEWATARMYKCPSCEETVAIAPN
jgi:hypothetical protein